MDTAVATLRFPGGALGGITGGRRHGGGYDNRVEVVGERGARTAGVDDRTPLTPVEDGRAPRIPYDGFTDRWAVAYRRELDVFAAVVAGEVPNPCPALAGLHALELAAACERARRSGATEPVPPAP
ncbi:MAG TPA: Gfo/Idh/MocA family oxidoreductase [Pseudonocardiaceae bacterium]